jgi:Family of unknown function (DUF5317)
VFVLFAIPLGIALGYLLGGRLDRLADVRFEWAWLAVGGLLVQVLLFSPLLTEGIGDQLGAAIYVASTAAVLVAVVRNIRRLPALALVALGAVSNLAAVIANGGVMPTTAAALATAGLAPADGFSNSAVIADPRLAPLTDVYALPAGLPLANVFSIGDVLIGLGVVVVIAAAMRSAGSANRQGAENPAAPADSTASDPATPNSAPA